MFIPAICASYGNVEAVSGYKVNYYIGNGVSAKKSPSITKEYQEIVDANCDIVMVHLIIPHDVGSFYKSNLPYYGMLRNLGKIGITLHYRMPKNHMDENTLFSEILNIHRELPQATIYLENEYSDLYGVLNVIMALRALHIDSWILIDTCHLEMDRSLKNYDSDWGKCEDDYAYLFETYKDFIGAFHISASKQSEGFCRETHGKPILSMEDEIFFRQISEKIISIDYGHDVILIPEVTEKRYGKKCDRVNGKKGMKILNEIIESNRRPL